MSANFKREFLLGMISILILSILIGYSVIKYKSQSVTRTNLASIPSNTILSSVEINKHNNPSDCWLLIQGKVYVVSDFLSRHPGGAGFITPYCGRDATQPFLTKAGKGSHSQEAYKLLGLIYIGDQNGKVIKQPDKNAIKSIKVGEGNDD